MKRIIVITLLLASFIGAAAQDGKSIYKKYSDREGVSAVYISPAMFRLIGKVPDLKIEDENVNLAPIIPTLSGLYIINSENDQICDGLQADVERFVTGGQYELLMEAKDSGETVRMYTTGDDTIVNSFVMLSVEPGETSFICIDGKMKREDLEKTLSGMVK